MTDPAPPLDVVQIAEVAPQRGQMPWWVPTLLAAIVLLIYGGALAASCMIDDGTLRTQMFTGAYGLASLAAGFFFGSSAGSQKKDDTIAAVATRPPPAV